MRNWPEGNVFTEMFLFLAWKSMCSQCAASTSGAGRVKRQSTTSVLPPGPQDIGRAMSRFALSCWKYSIGLNPPLSKGLAKVFSCTYPSTCCVFLAGSTQEFQHLSKSFRSLYMPWDTAAALLPCFWKCRTVAMQMRCRNEAPGPSHYILIEALCFHFVSVWGSESKRG